jgi:hypothetical protein
MPRHLLQLEGLEAPELTALLDRAEAFIPAARGEVSATPVLAGRLVANLFFEDSTRTRLSFEAAAAMMLKGLTAEYLLFRTYPVKAGDTILVHAAAGGTGSRGVLEVRCHEAPFVLEHGQVVGRLVYERMSERPDTLYGAGISSNYQGQGLKLAKQFRME